jgi:hypothetical protein
MRGKGHVDYIFYSLLADRIAIQPGPMQGLVMNLLRGSEMVDTGQVTAF